MQQLGCIDLKALGRPEDPRVRVEMGLELLEDLPKCMAGHYDQDVTDRRQCFFQGETGLQ